jgi:hypothetical protein
LTDHKFDANRAKLDAWKSMPSDDDEARERPSISASMAVSRAKLSADTGEVDE